MCPTSSNSFLKFFFFFALFLNPLPELAKWRVENYSLSLSLFLPLFMVVPKTPVCWCLEGACATPAALDAAKWSCHALPLMEWCRCTILIPRHFIIVPPLSSINLDIFGILVPRSFQGCPFYPVKVTRKLACFFVQPSCFSNFLAKRSTFMVNHTQISDLYSISFNSRYNMSMFSEISKIAFYKAKLSIWVRFNLHARLTWARNKKSKPLPDLFWCHESSGNLKIFKWAFR